MRVRSSSLLFCVGAWMPNRDNLNQWIQADLITTHRIESVTTRGKPGSYACWVTAYFVSHSPDETSWVEISTPFEANDDGGTMKTNLLPDNIEARFIRLSPNSWNYYICMRFDVTGCAVTGTITFRLLRQERRPCLALP